MCGWGGVGGGVGGLYMKGCTLYIGTEKPIWSFHIMSTVCVSSGSKSLLFTMPAWEDDKNNVKGLNIKENTFCPQRPFLKCMSISIFSLSTGFQSGYKDLRCWTNTNIWLCYP